MPLSADAPNSFKPAAEVLVDLIRETFASGRVERPATIDLRSRTPDIRVEGGDRVTVYRGGAQQRERVGNRHYKVAVPLKVDIRSAYADRADELLDHIVESLDRETVAPKGAHPDWDEVICGEDTDVARFEGDVNGRGGLTHIVLDVQLVKHLRQRNTARILE